MVLLDTLESSKHQDVLTQRARSYFAMHPLDVTAVCEHILLCDDARAKQLLSSTYYGGTIPCELPS